MVGFPIQLSRTRYALLTAASKAFPANPDAAMTGWNAPKAAVCRSPGTRLFATESGPDASAQSVGRAARLSRNVRQSNHVLAN